MDPFITIMESVHQEDLIILNMCAHNIRASTHMHQNLLKLPRTIDTITFIAEIEWNFSGMYRIPCELRTILWLINEKGSYILISWGCHNRGPQMDGLKEEKVIASCSGDYRAKVLSELWSLKPLRENLYLLLVSNGCPQSLAFLGLQLHRFSPPLSSPDTIPVCLSFLL